MGVNFMSKILVILFLLFSFSGNSQSYLYIIGADENSEKVISKIKYQKKLNDSLAVENELKNVFASLRDMGYLTAKVNKNYKSDTAFAQFAIGQIHEITVLRKGNADVFMLGEIGWQANDFEQPWSLKKTVALLEQIIDYYENNGYPFARLKLDSVDFSADSLFAALNVTSGPYRSTDSIVVKSETKIPAGYVRYHLGLKSGKPYNEKQLHDVKNAVNSEGTFGVNRSPQVLFEKQKTTVFVYLDEQNSNRISGIAGINTKEDGTVFFTGELDLSLRHIFKAAEKIEFNWLSPRSGSQQLNLDLDFPFLFKSPMGFVFNFNLYREDTLFSNRNFLIGLSLRPTSKAGLSLSFQDKKSGNINGAVGFADVRTQYILLSTYYNNLNHNFLPTKGNVINVMLGQGSRNSNDENQTQYTALFQLRSFFTLYKNNKIFISLKGEGLFNTPLVTNELFRIGGVKSIRGFNEQSIFASQYAFSQIEYRYFLERFTYVFLFVDGGYAQNTVPSETVENILIGTGAGFSFYTKGGIFSIAFAVGQQNGLGFNVNNSKVHIGYVNRF